MKVILLLVLWVICCVACWFAGYIEGKARGELEEYRRQTKK